MRTENKPLSEEKTARLTEINQYRLDRYRTCVSDPEKEKRILSNECQICYYLEDRIGGAALTETNCGKCEKTIHFGSTSVDLLCKDCASSLNLCKYCGCSIDLK